MSDGPTAEAIEGWAREVAGWPVDEPATVATLDGGFSWQTSRVTCGSESVIVRVAPLGGTVEPHDAHAEARHLHDARAAGVPVPDVMAVDDERLGRPAAVHSFIAGENVRPGAAVNDPDAYVGAFARTLATIHTAMPAEAISIRESYERTIHEEMEHYRRTAPCAHPGFEIGWQWLLANLPDDDRPAVRLHGDYRLANLLWAKPGDISGVLDWERSRTGDPMCDVAFTRLFSGWCAIAGSGGEVYAAASGIAVDEERVAYAEAFERWRSFTSAMRGLAAFVGGRNTDRRLIRIGLAGEAGAWRFVEDHDLEAQWDRASLPPGRYESSVVAHEAHDWPALADADTRAMARAMDALHQTSLHYLPTDLGETDPDELFAAAHELAVQMLAMGRPPRDLLQALALRATLRFELIEEHGWH